MKAAQDAELVARGRQRLASSSVTPTSGRPSEVSTLGFPLVAARIKPAPCRQKQVRFPAPLRPGQMGVSEVSAQSFQGDRHAHQIRLANASRGARTCWQKSPACPPRRSSPRHGCGLYQHYVPPL